MCVGVGVFVFLWVCKIGARMYKKNLNDEILKIKNTQVNILLYAIDEIVWVIFRSYIYSRYSKGKQIIFWSIYYVLIQMKKNDEKPLETISRIAFR